MNATNWTMDKIPTNITTLDFATNTAALFDFDSTWQLAVTVEIYFQYAIIGIGVFGVAANTMVLYALIAYHLQQSKKRAVNLLMINQNILDLSSCILLVITFSVKASNIYLSGTLGYFLCTILISENATNSTLNASIINLKVCLHRTISSDLVLYELN